MERLPHPAPLISCRIWDHYQPWEIAVSAAAQTAPATIAVDTAFAYFDWLHVGPWDVAAAVGDANVLTLSYALSEVWRYNAGNAVSFNLDRIIGALQPGAVVLYSDNSGPCFDPHVEAHLFGRADLALLNRHVHDHMLIGPDEQAAVNNAYRQLMGAGEGTMPKLRGKATSAAFRKIAT
jgi:hypothetical protein